MKRSPSLSWDTLVDSAIRGRLALPLWVMFSYLAESLRAEVPTCVLEALAAAAADTDMAGMEAALYGARMGSRGSLSDLHRRARSWRSRVVFYKWVLLPSPRYLHWRYPTIDSWRLPSYYIGRPLRYLVRRVQRALRRHRAIEG